MGKQCFSITTAIKMLRSQSKTIQDRLLAQLRQSDAPLSLVLDGSTSKGNEHYMGKTYSGIHIIFQGSLQKCFLSI